MITENALADLFEKAVQDLDPAVHTIVAAAERRGRRLRTRRRAWLALGSGLMVATLTGTALAAGGPLAHPRAAPVTAGAPSRHKSSKHAGTGRASPKRSRRSASPTPSGSSYHVGPPPKLAPGYRMTLGQMLDVLKHVLPAGSTLSNVDPYAWKDGMLEVDYNDGKGAVDLLLGIDPTATFTYGTLACQTWPDEGQRPAGALPISCAMRRLPDGSIERDWVTNANAFGFYGYNIYDQRPDGITVYIQVADGTNHWPRPYIDRARPPGSMAEWEAVVESPAWHLKKGWQLGAF